jgi:hypothetical protein
MCSCLPLASSPAAAAVLAVLGAAPADDKSAQPRDEKVCRTGSNIPRGDNETGAKSTGAEDVKGQMIPSRPSEGGFGG